MPKKELGQVFSPDWIVNLILDLINYKEEYILEKYILEPSCGNGMFLKNIVKRYIEKAKSLGLTNIDIEKHLDTYIYGIELDTPIYNECITNLNTLVSSYGLKVSWKNILNQNTIYTNNLPKMDYVVGNPPYVRSVNIKDKEMVNYIKTNFKLSTKGCMDLYITFYEYGMNVLKDNGKLCYISPNTFINNTSFKLFREYIKENNYMSKILNFEDIEVFKASTYNAILLLEKNKKNNYFEVLSYEDNKVNIINKQDITKLDTENWIIGSKYKVDTFYSIRSRQSILNVYTTSKYGINTLCDKVFISDNVIYDIDTTYQHCIFNGYTLEKDLLVDVIKASKYKGEDIKSKVIFPYKKVNSRYEVISSEEMKEKYPLTYKYLLDHKDLLLDRDLEKNYKEFYQFGRSQGIQDFEKEKLVVNILFKDKIHINKIKGNTLVYAGIYIAGENLDFIKDVLSTNEFLFYANCLGKDKKGSFKALTSKIINNYRF